MPTCHAESTQPDTRHTLQGCTPQGDRGPAALNLPPSLWVLAAVCLRECAVSAPLRCTCRRTNQYQYDVDESQKKYNSMVFNAFIFMQVCWSCRLPLLWLHSLGKIVHKHASVLSGVQ